MSSDKSIDSDPDYIKEFTDDDIKKEDYDYYKDVALMYNNLKEAGYHVFEMKKTDIEIIGSFLKNPPKLPNGLTKPKEIFQSNNQRFMTAINSETIFSIAKKYMLPVWFKDEHEIIEAHILTSYHGCIQQTMHCDAATFGSYQHEEDLSKMPYSMIMSPLKDMHIAVPPSRRNRDGRINIKKGHGIVFRGDFIHAGME